VLLPTDQAISLALRAFRDRYGTRQRPVGIVQALEHLLKDMGIPLYAVGEMTYTTLMTCSRTPAEARRILQLMKQQQHSISEYSWSILTDVYAKIGDFEGCAATQDEMAAEGIPPTLASYTSLLAACYKAANDGGRVAHNIRAKAGKLAWQKWQEMRVVGVDPDVMAYGAILRVTAAQGQPERALNILQEMQQLQVKPTTLCFTSALKAVARSHATAIRYERGSSRKSKRREFITSHHGKLARSILIMAENAQVEQDDGFVSALILCAAASGDVATAKAVYVASQIRKLDQFRTIGPDSHLARLRGEESLVEQLQIGEASGSSEVALSEDSVGSLKRHEKSTKKRYPSFAEREYGKDSRALSAILRACAQATDQNGIGTMWQGRENEGYLCVNSLRLLQARRVPQYTDNSIPGQGRLDELRWAGEDKDEDYRGGKRKRRKFEGIEYDEDAGTTLDELDEQFSRMFLEDDGRLKKEYRKTTYDDIWRMKYGDDDGTGDPPEAIPEIVNSSDEYVIDSSERKPTSLPQQSEPKEEMYFDYDTMRWQTRPRRLEQVTPEIVGEEEHDAAPRVEEEEEKEELYFDKDAMKWKTRPKGSKPAPTDASEKIEEKKTKELDIQVDKADEEMYFDKDAMQWKTRTRTEAEAARLTDFENRVLSSNQEQANKVDSNDRINEIGAERAEEIDEEEFTRFFADLKKEIADSGEDMDDLEEEEARELFLLARDEYNEMMSMDLEELGLTDLSKVSQMNMKDLNEFNVDAVGDLQSSDSGIHDFHDSEPSSATDTDESGGHDMVESGKAEKKDFTDFIEGIKDEWREQGVQLDEDEDQVPDMRDFPQTAEGPRLATTEAAPGRSPADGLMAGQARTSVGVVDNPEPISTETPNAFAMEQIAGGRSYLEDAVTQTVEVLDNDDEVDPQLEELREFLPAFPDKRLRKILKAFRQSLGDPSLLELSLIVRERMPDYITNTWLKQMSALTARFVMHKAAQDGLVDTHILNGVLEMEAAAGQLDRALEFRQNEFQRHKLEPTEYSDRLVVQMFLKNSRFQRALRFKETIEESDRSLDIPSYGSLIDYCGRQGQLGSALLLLKECMSVHGAHPGEAYLKRLRLLCRQKDVVKEAGLPELIGEDPIEWLRHGEAKLKREMSKKGRRDVQLARNVLLQV